MISCGVQICIARGGQEMVRAYLLVAFFSFSFCNYVFIVIRYKKPHAALAMERTKPIKQKHKQKKVTAPANTHYSMRFPSAGPMATSTRQVQTKNLAA